LANQQITFAGARYYLTGPNRDILVTAISGEIVPPKVPTLRKLDAFAHLELELKRIEGATKREAAALIDAASTQPSSQPTTAGPKSSGRFAERLRAEVGIRTQLQRQSLLRLA